MDRHTNALDQDTLDEIIRRIVAVAQPEKIILFGSAARGEMDRTERTERTDTVWPRASTAIFAVCVQRWT